MKNLYYFYEEQKIEKMARASKKALKKKRAAKTEKNFFLYSVLITIGFLIIFFIVFNLGR